MSFNPGQYSFHKDINTGEQGEEVVIQYFEGQGCILLERCKTVEYDAALSFNGQRITIEIKTDVIQPDRGNIAIEFWSRERPSGIDATKADYFITYFPFLGEIWSIKSDELRKLIKEEKPRQVVGGDKGSNTCLYLFNRKKYKQYFKIINVEKVKAPN